MTPGKYDLRLYRGDTYSWTFRLWHDAGKTDPVDLETAEVAAQIRNKSGGEIVIDLPCEVVSSGPPGNPDWNTIHTTIPADHWASAPGLGAGMWDLEITYADGTVQTVLAGKVTVTGDVTHSTAAPVVARSLRSA